MNLAYFSSRSFSVGFNKSYIVFYATCGRRRKFAQKLALKAYLAEYTKPAENLSVEPCKSVLIRVKPVSVSQFQKSPCQLVSMSIHRFRQPARSKERGNSFAGGQGTDLHRCLHRERAATGTPSRLTFALFAVNKIRVNLRQSVVQFLLSFLCGLCALCG